MARSGPFPSLSVFFPAYNDAPSLPELIAKTFAVLELHVADYEVIVVNDGSYDNTAAVLEQLRAPYGPAPARRHPLRGIAAMAAPCAAASKPPPKISSSIPMATASTMSPSCRACWISSARIPASSMAIKLERHDPAHRIWIGKTYNFCARLLFRIRIRDIDCDYRLIRRSLLQRIHLTSTSGTICVELVRKLEMTGCEVIETGVHHYPRLYGKSQFFRLRSLATTLYEFLRFWVRVVILRRKRRTEAPTVDAGGQSLTDSVNDRVATVPSNPSASNGVVGSMLGHHVEAAVLCQATRSASGAKCAPPWHSPRIAKHAQSRRV